MSTQSCDDVLSSNGTKLGAFAPTCACFVLSGAAALIYQTAWTRQFALVFGTSELAIATVLAAYMGGLALGAYLIERWLPRIRRPVRWYAFLELGIGAAALVWVPLALSAAEKLLVAMYGHQSAPPSSEFGGNSIFYLISASATLLLPTALMGATLPLLTRYAVQSDEQLAARISSLYACNTAGAVVGALLTALVLLPDLGLRGAQWTAAIINLSVCGVALWLGRDVAATSIDDGAPIKTAAEEIAASNDIDRFSYSWRELPSTPWVLPLMLLSGAVSFIHEVLWTRMLSHVLGGSIYAFGVMVASFLTGIAVGGGAGAWLARTRERAVIALALAELCAAVATAFAWYALQQWVPSYDDMAVKILFGLLVLLPLALAIGFTYPLAVHVLANGTADAALASARVYAWNTSGAIVGAIAGGFWLIPALRYEGAVRFAFVASCVLALLMIVMLKRQRVMWWAGVAVPALIACVLFQPAQPTRLLQVSPLDTTATGDPVFYDVGRSATVVMLDRGASILMRTNGLPESSIDKPGVPPKVNAEAWLPALAVLARPATSSMLVVGYGAGRVLEAVPPSVSSIDVIELEPKVLDANRAMHSIDPLNDPRVTVVLNDARGALMLTDKHYDAIVSQPSHPWTAGASHLYTREFMLQTRAHLNAGGVFVQWMNINFMDEALFKSLVATLRSVYDHVRVYRTNQQTLMLVASMLPLAVEQQPQQIERAIARAPRHYANLAINVPEDLLMPLVLDDKGAQALSQNAPLLTDDRNRLATARVYERHVQLRPDELGRMLQPYDPLTHRDSFVFRELRERIKFDYLARLLQRSVAGDKSALARLIGMANALGPNMDGRYAGVIGESLSHGEEIDPALIPRSLQVAPQADALRFELVRPCFGALAYDQAPQAIMKAAQELSADPAMVVTAARHAARQEWDQLAILDDALAQVSWTKPWAPEAIQLRAEWRVHTANLQLRPKLCAEALSLVDQLNIAAPKPLLLALRAWAGAGLKRPDIVLESISAFAQRMADRSKANRPKQDERPALRSSLSNLLPLLDKLQTDAGVSSTRLTQVGKEISAAKQALQ